VKKELWPRMNTDEHGSDENENSFKILLIRVHPCSSVAKFLWLAGLSKGAHTFGQGDGARAHAIGDGAGPVAVDFDGDGTLEQVDGNYEAIYFVGIGDDAFQAGEGAVLDIDLGTDFEEGPRAGGEAGTKDGANGLDLVLIDGEGGFAGADDTDDAGGGEDGQEAAGDVETAEEIAGEEREIEFLEAVRPAAAGAIEGKELLVALAA